MEEACGGSTLSRRSPVLHWLYCDGEDEDVLKLQNILEKDPEALERIVPEVDSKTPLQRAVILKHQKCISALLSFGANPNVTNVFGTTALHFALHHDTTEIAELLLKNGANPNYELDGFHSVGNAGRTQYLMVSCRISAYNMVKLLLEYGAVTEDLTSLTEHDVLYTPLSVATLQGDAATVKLLLLYGAIANLKNFPKNVAPRALYSLPHILIEECMKSVETKISILRIFHEFGVDLSEPGGRKGLTALQVLQQRVPAALDPLRMELQSLTSTPLSLQSLCRNTIRKALGSNFLKKNSNLPYLPPQLYNFLKFQDL